MPQRVLVVDANPGFAQMVAESINAATLHQAVACTSAQDALALLAREPFAMAIVDSGMEDPPAVKLVQEMRRQAPALRIMLIPVQGNTLEADFRTLDYQGVLPRPFFFDELPALVERALNAPIAAGAEAAYSHGARTAERPAEEAGPVSPPQRAAPILLQAIVDLQRELAANAVLLLGPRGVVVSSGDFGGASEEQVGERIQEMERAVRRALSALAGKDVELHQGYCEAEAGTLIWQMVPPGWLLVCVLHEETPLGLARYHVHLAAARIAAIAPEEAGR